MGACADVRRKRGKEPKRKLSGFYQGVWNTISGLADARWFAAVRWPVVEFLHRSFGVRSTSTLPRPVMSTRGPLGVVVAAQHTVVGLVLEERRPVDQPLGLGQLAPGFGRDGRPPAGELRGAC